jgi:hypothetical protein
MYAMVIPNKILGIISLNPILQENPQNSRFGSKEEWE